MREFEISDAIHGEPQQVWDVFTDFSAYGEWNRLIPVASGSVVPGARLDLRIERGGLRVPFRPTVVSADPPHAWALAASVGHRSLIHMVHHFTISGTAPDLQLQQRWEATGALVPPLWFVLCRSMERFHQLGSDLNERLATLGKP